MGAGRPPKPVLTVVREGNPGHRPLREGVVLPPTDLDEPDWAEILPGRGAEAGRVRSDAAGLWQKLAPTLSRSVGLVNAQRELLVDYCVTWARIRQGERALSTTGIVIRTDRGTAKNAWTTVLNQYRPHLRSLMGELGLTPAAAARLQRPPIDDDEDPFD